MARAIRRSAGGDRLRGPRTLRRLSGLPRFLTSALDDPAPSFAAQLDDIQAIPGDQVRRDVREVFGDDVPRAYVPFLTRPDRAVRRVCEALAQYWTVMVEPLWPRMREVLQREVVRQAVALTTRPVGEALDDIHPGMRFDGTLLAVASRAQSDRAEIGGRVLMLTPLVSAPGGLLADIHDVDRVKVGYAARGAHRVWGTNRSTWPPSSMRCWDRGGR